jgi:hypothetical protein
MRYSIVEQDFRSGLALLRDGGDPPRYYIRQARRLELIAIGNENAARSRFAVRCSRARRKAAPPPPEAVVMALRRGADPMAAPRDGPRSALQAE